MKFTAWEARKHIEAKYKTALRKLGRFLIGLISDDDSYEDIQKKLSDVQSSNPFNRWAQSLAHTFVTNTLEENARTWRQAAQSKRGRVFLFHAGDNHPKLKIFCDR